MKMDTHAGAGMDLLHDMRPIVSGDVGLHAQLFYNTRSLVLPRPSVVLDVRNGSLLRGHED